MRPLTRVVATGLFAVSLAGVLALRPTAAANHPQLASQTAAQAVAVEKVQAQSARAALAARELAASRHRAYLKSRAALAAAEAARRAARQAAQAAASVAAAKQPTTAVRRTAAAPTRVVSTETYLARGTRIYNSFHYDVSKLGYRMVFKPSVHGLLGLTDGTAHTVTVYIRSSESDLVLAHSIAHEIGHALDFSRGSDAKHNLYSSIRHLSTTQFWYGCNNCTDYATPAGDWAEVFAQWLAGPGDFRSQMGGVPTAAQLSQLDDLFRL
jgi:hypothetical protein